eukprot:g32184.t1
MLSVDTPRADNVKVVMPEPSSLLRVCELYIKEMPNNIIGVEDMSETTTTTTTTTTGTTTATTPAVYEFKATSDANPWEHEPHHYEKVREYAEIYDTLNYSIVREKIVMTKGKPTGIPMGKIGRKYDADFNKPWKFKQGENIAMRTGVFSNVSVLDIDNKPVKGFKFTSVEIFKAMLGFFSKTDEETKTFIKLAPRAITGGGGYHIFLPYLSNVKNMIQFPTMRLTGDDSEFKLDWDLKNDWGKITLPPSIHKSGKMYEWKMRPDKYPPINPPQWLIRMIYGAPCVMIISNGGNENEAVFEVLDIPPTNNKITDGDCFDFSGIILKDLPATADELKEVVKWIPAIMADNYTDWQKVLWAIRWTAEACEALKHETINKDVGLSLAIEFSKQSDKFTGDDDIIEMWNAGTKGLLKYGSLIYWAKENGYEHKRQPYKAVDYLEKLIKKTKEAEAKAVAEAEPVAVAVAEAKAEPVAVAVAEAKAEPVAEPVAEAKATDNSNYDHEKAKAFMDGNDDDYAEFIYAKYENRFICFNNAVYEFPPNAHLWDAGDDDIFHNFLGSVVFNELMIFTDNLIRILREELMKETDEDKQKDIGKYYNLNRKKQKQMIIKLRNYSTRGGIVKCLKAKYAVKKCPFDINSNLVGFNNGVYDLVKSEFRNGKPDDYVSMSVGYNYEPRDTNKQTKLNEFLNKVMPYDDVRDYLLQAMATGLYGQQIQKFFILTGAGGNGKDTLMTKLYRGMLGEYYINAHIGIITEKPKKDELNQGLANLHNKRACVFVEPCAKNNLIGASIKSLTGTDNITARGLYEKTAEKRNVNTMFCLANDIPIVDHLDGGCVRRLEVIEFPTLFKTRQQMADMEDLTNIYEADPYYESAEFIKDYKLPLFHILTDLFKVFINNGYKLNNTPERVLRASAYYLRNCDDFMMWFNEVYEKGETKDFIQIQDVCAEYKHGDLYANLTKRERRLQNNKFITDKIKNHANLRGYCKEEYKPLIDGRQRKFRNVIMGKRLNEYLNEIITTPATPQETLQNISQINNYLTATHPDTYAQLIKAGLAKLRGKRIGVYTSYFQDAHPTVVETASQALQQLVEKYEMELVEVTIPHLNVLKVSHTMTIVSEMMTSLDREIHNRSQLGLELQINLLVSKLISAADYVAAQRVRTYFMEITDKLFTPISEGGSGLDFLATPTSGITAPMVNDAALPQGESNMPQLSDIMRFTYLGNFAGVPGVSLPAGYDEAGLPIGLQLYARWWAEDSLLQMAYAHEQLFAPQRRRPPFCSGESCRVNTCTTSDIAVVQQR